MPFINVKTNANVSKEKAKKIKSAFGNAITVIPGKSEDWLMVGIEGDYTLYFKGTREPAAMVEVQIYGNALAHYVETIPSPGKRISLDSSVNKISELTSRISDILSDILEIPLDRIYVSYMYTQHWGWNGSNF